MSSSDLYPFFVHEEVADKGEGRPQLVVLQRHWVDGDDSVVLVLPCWLTAKGDSAPRQPVPTMIHMEITNEEGVGVDEKICHVGNFTVELWVGVFYGWWRRR